MAGYLIDVTLLEGSNGQANPSSPTDATGTLEALGVDFGPRSSERVPRTPAEAGGYEVRDWRPDYGDRIIVTIDNANFGTVAGVVQRVLKIENRYSVAKSVTAQGTIGASGVLVVGFPALPFSLLPTEEREWIVQAAAEGDPVITGYLTFTIGAEALRTVDLSGIRAIVWPHQPNWAQPIDIDRGFAEQIGDALSLAETRESYGDVALIRQKFTTLAIDADEASAKTRTLERARALPVGMPLWTEYVLTTGDLAAGAGALPVTDTSKRRFTQARPFIVLWVAWNRWAIVEATAIATNSITLAGELLEDWPAGTRVMPVRFGNLRLSASQAAVNDSARRTAVTWEEAPL